MNRVNTILLFISFLLFIIPSSAQDFYVKNYPSPSGERLYKNQIECLKNGDYITAGYTNGSNPNWGKILVKRLNKCGDEVWSKEISTPNASLRLVDLDIDSSQNILLSGLYTPVSDTQKTSLIKLTSLGNLIYARQLNTSSNYNTLLSFTAIATNGDYLLSFTYNYTSSPPNNYRTSVSRIQPDGTIKWLMHYDFSHWWSWASISATKDNGAIVSNSDLIFKIDSTGIVEWSNRYDFRSPNTAALVTDSSYILFNFIRIGNISRAYAVAIHLDGSVAWSSDTLSNFYPIQGIIRKNNQALFIGAAVPTITGIDQIQLIELDPSNGTITQFEQLPVQHTFLTDLTEDSDANILFSAGYAQDSTQQLILGKLNDTLSVPSCTNTQLAHPNNPATFAIIADSLTVGTLNSDLTNPPFTVNLTTIPPAVSLTSCEFTKPRGNYKLGRDTILCPKQSLLLGSSASSYDSYLWSTGEQTKTITISSAGSYSVILTAACDTLRDTIEVNYYPIIGLDLGRDTSLCNGDSIELGKNLNFTNYNWSDGSTNPTLTVKQSGVYWLEVQTNCGPVRDSIELLVLPPSNSPLLGNDTTICFGDSLTLNPGLLPNYNWSTGAQSPSITVLDSGLFWVESQNTCDTLRDSIQVNFFPELNVQYQTSSLEAFVGDSITFENLTQNSLSTLWDFADGNTSTLDLVRHSFSQIGTYKVQLLQQSSGACMESIVITIVIKASDYYAPTIFSPNNDGINDFFFPVGKDIVHYEMEIFNRWGASIFESNNVAWNGKSNNDVRVDQGVYQYIIHLSLTNERKATIKGSITIVR